MAQTHFKRLDAGEVRRARHGEVAVHGQVAADCNGNFNSFTGACVGIKLPSGQFSADCGYLPGQLPNGSELLCLCATF